MKKSNVTASIIPDKRLSKKNGAFPLKLRITCKGERRYYATGYDANVKEWEIIQSGKTRTELKKKSLALSEIQIKAQRCCDELEIFSFGKFEVAFFPKTVVTQNVQTAFENYIDNLNANEQVGTAFSYYNACTSLHKFKSGLKFEHITPEFLRSYERWFIGQKKSITTVGIYLRSLRAVINVAIEQGIMDRNDYPFGKRKYIIPSGRNIKKALTLEEIAKIYNYPAKEGSVEDMCRDYWMFIYLCNGLNVKDFCLLTHKNIEGDFIVFHRAKTIRTRRANPEPIRVALKEDSKQIIKKWGQQELLEDTFIFPCLTMQMSANEKKDKIALLVHLINEHMRTIAKNLNIQKSVTTYYARHSFATILKNSGVSTEFISEALGHSSLSTTKNYLAGFEQEAIKSATDALIAFKNVEQK
jgi:site-specific recombinase XerD